MRKCAAGFNLTRVAALSVAVCPGVTVDLRGAKPLMLAQQRGAGQMRSAARSSSIMEIRE